MRASSCRVVLLGAVLSIAGLVPLSATQAEAKDVDWVSTELTASTALSTGKYDVRASYRSVYKDTPITVYVLQNPSDRADVLECYSNDTYESTVNCVKPKGSK